MRPGGIGFHHPVAFWTGCALIVAGVFSHAPMFLMGEHTGWHMAGMPMDAWMLWGMAMIPAGVVLAGYGLMPRLARAAWAAWTLCWLHVLRVAPLSRAYGLTSLTYVLVPLASVYVLGEQVRRMHVAGIIMIAVGIACVLASD